ncbi:MAG: hypothetical protein MZV64_11960 [Ignavibacteriales bacterium]|nr:hypothetical protein [Ignavibacteriales bacterium]
MDEEPKPLDLDLDEELEKLRKIKELLTVESAAANLGRLGGPAAPEEELAALDAAAVKTGPDIPGIPELIAGPAPEEQAAAEPVPPAPEPVAPARRRPDRGRTRRPGSNPIAGPNPPTGAARSIIFQKGRTIVADPEKLLAAVDRTLEEGQRLSVKLDLTESPKDQFFIKQELINWQEGLQAPFPPGGQDVREELLGLPFYTEEILDPQILRRLLERLSMENWSNLEEFTGFSDAVAEIRRAFLARIEPRLPYLRALKRQVEGD